MEYKFLEFTVCGLIFDAFGVFLLGVAFFFKSKNTIINESDMYWDSNPHVLRSIVASRLDGICGTTLLLTGFIFQLCGYYNATSKLITGTSYILLIVFIIYYFLCLRNITIIEYCDDLIKISKQRDAQPNSETMRRKIHKIANVKQE